YGNSGFDAFSSTVGPILAQFLRPQDVSVVDDFRVTTSTSIRLSITLDPASPIIPSFAYVTYAYAKKDGSSATGAPQVLSIPAGSASPLHLDLPNLLQPNSQISQIAVSLGQTSDP